MLAASDAAQQRYNSFFTAVKGPKASAPDHFALHQNYPNPFNPSTEIRFEIAKNSLVNLTVYDMAGREVKTLVNGAVAAGAHTVNFDATDLTSGVYFYTLRANNYTATRKLLLMR